MAKLPFMLILLMSAAMLTATDEIPGPSLLSIDLDAGLLLYRPSLAAADTMALQVEASREVFYKLSERGEILAAGKLLPGTASLQFVRPGLFAQSQTLFFLLDLLENGSPSQKKITLTLTVDRESETSDQKKAGPSGSFTLGMYHGGRMIGFRKKSMTEMLNLKTGPVAPVADPGISGSAIRSRPESQSVSVLGLGMALAKFLAGKKLRAAEKAHLQALQKKRLSLTFQSQKNGGAAHTVKAEIELRVD
jgi:hypothetical protein